MKTIRTQLNLVELATDTSEDGEKTLPSEFQIIGMGATATTKGDIVLDDDAGESVMKAWKDYGNELVIEFDHRFSGDAAGWFTPEYRPGEGLYAKVNFWTELGKEKLSKGLYRFFSPVIWQEVDSRKIVSIDNIALVNSPATKNQKPLVLSNQQEDLNMSDTQVTENSDASVQLDAKGELAKAQEAHAQLVEALSGETPDLDAARAASEALSASLEALAGELAGSDGEGEGSEGESAPGDPGTEPEASSKEGVSLSKQDAELVELRNFKAKADEEKKSLLITNLCLSGKLQPSEKEWASKHLSIEALQDMDNVRAPASFSQSFQAPPTSGETKLSPHDEAICNQYGLDKETYLQTKIKRNQ